MEHVSADRSQIDTDAVERIASELGTGSRELDAIHAQLRRLEADINAAGPAARRALGTVQNARGTVAGTADHLDRLQSDVRQRLRLLDIQNQGVVMATLRGPLPPPDRSQRAAWWAGLSEDQRQQYVRAFPADVAYLATQDELAQAGYQTLQQVYVRQAFLDAGIDANAWDPNRGLKDNDAIVQAVYAYYQQLWDNNHDLQWAGMAKLAGAPVYAGIRDMYVLSQLSRDQLVQRADAGNPLAQFAVNYGTGELTYFETQFLSMQQSIFMDLAWQHAAYAHGGIEAVNALASGPGAQLTSDLQAAWQQIDSGDPAQVAAGNAALLHREQFDVLDRQYAALRDHNGPEGRIFTDILSENTRSPIPSGTPFRDVVGPHVDIAQIGNTVVGIDAADVTVFPDRWTWITQDMLPRYRDLLAHPSAAQATIDTPLATRALDYQQFPELHVDGY